MPNVTAPTRVMNNGEAITYFTDTVGTSSVTWTYQNEQEGLTVTNKGVSNLTLTVNGVNYTITPGGVQTVSAVFTAFTIVSASGTQQFDAHAWSFQKDTVIAQLSGSSLRQGEGAQVYARTGFLGASTIETVVSFATGKSVELMAVEFSTADDTNCRIVIEAISESGTVTTINAAGKDGFSTVSLSPSNIRTHKSAIFDLVVDAASNYKLILKPGIRLLFPNGCNIKVQNSDTVQEYVTLTALIRKVVA